jgi:glyoxylase-like metal-dependent hydrolase (beta-lactamase superfamily II)
MSTAPAIHVHTSSPDAFFVNSFLIEGAHSLVLIDTQFVLSEARLVCDKLAALQKPLAGIFITHPHPDHYNGLATVLAAFPETKVHATAGTIAGIRETAEPKRAYWTPIVGANYPQTFAFPDVTVTDGQRLTIDGIELIVHDFGPAECSDNTAIELPQIDAVILSDLVYNRVHPWLAEGRSDKWLMALDDAKQRFGKANALFAGHGPVGSAAIIDEQKAYIITVRDLVAKILKRDGALSDASRATIQEDVKGAYPGLPLEMIIDMNSGSLATELAAN